MSRKVSPQHIREKRVWGQTMLSIRVTAKSEGLVSAVVTVKAR
jgi:hypothetical protein